MRATKPTRSVSFSVQNFLSDRQCLPALVTLSVYDVRLNPSGSAFDPLLLAAHPGLDYVPTSLPEESAPSVVIEVPMLPTVLFSSPMITIDRSLLHF